MAIGWRTLLAGVSLLFLVFLVVQLRPVRGRRGGLNGEIRAARQRARAATSPRAKAEALCEAASIAAKKLFQRSAAGLLLRAMRADPAWPHPIELATSTLQARRPRLLERLLWKRLSDLPWDDEHRAAVTAAALALRDLYRHKLRDSARAEFLERFTNTLG